MAKTKVFLLLSLMVLSFVLSSCFLLPKVTLKPVQLVYPSDGATGVPVNLYLVWQPANLQSTYKVFLGTGASTSLTTTSSTSIYVSNLNYSTTYYWKVVAISNGQTATSSTWSFTTMALPRPSTPILNVTGVSTNTISLAWKRSSGANAIFLYGSTSTNFSQYAILSGQSTSYTVRDLTPSTVYKFFIVATNASGRATSNTVNATTLSYTPPVIPALPVIKAFNVTFVSTNTITLGFQTQNASVIYIYNPPSKLLLATANGNATSYTITGLNPSTVYRYFIVAINPSGRATSNTITATTSVYIPPVSTFSVYITDKPVSPSQIQHLYVNISGISVHLSNTSTSTWYTSPASGTYDLTSLVGTSVHIANFSLPSTSTITQIRFDITSATIVINNISYPLIIPSRTVYVNIQPINAFESNGTYLDFNLSNSVEQTGQGYIFKPVVHSVNENMRASVTGKVLSNSTPVAMAIVSLSNSSTTVAQTYTKPNGIFTIAAVAMGNYTLTITASGLSSYSTSVSLSKGMNNVGTVNLSALLPATPTLTLSSTNTYSVNLKWSESVPVSAFRIWRTSNPMQAYSLVATVSGTQNTYTDIVEPGHTYYYMVSAVNPAGEKFSGVSSIFVGQKYFTMPTANALATVYVYVNQSNQSIQSANRSLIDTLKTVKSLNVSNQPIPVNEILQYQISQNYYNLNLSYAFGGYPNSTLTLSFINQNGAIYLQNFAPNPVLVLDSIYGNYPTSVATNAVVLLSSGATTVSYNYSRSSTYIPSATIGGNNYKNVLLVTLSGGGYTVNLYFAQGYGLVSFSMNQNNPLFQFTILSTNTTITPVYPSAPSIQYPSNNLTVPSTFTLKFSSSSGTYTIYIDQIPIVATNLTNVKIGPLTNGTYNLAVKSTNSYKLETLSPAIRFYVSGGWVATPTYVIGTFTNWATNSNYQMTYNSLTHIYTLSTTIPSSPSVYGVNEYMIAQSYMGKIIKYGYQPIPVSTGNVTFYFNPSMAKPFTSLGIGDSSKANQSWYFAGDMSNWNFVQMTGNNGIFTATVTNSTIFGPGTYKFKITPQSTFSVSPANLLPYYFNGSYSAYFLSDGTLSLATPSNTFVIQFNTMNSQVKIISATITTLPCYVAGNFNGWSPNPAYKMSYSATSGLYYLTTTLPATTGQYEYKIVYNDNWYGGSNIPVGSGNVTFYFNPTNNGGSSSDLGIGDTSKESMRWYFSGQINSWSASPMEYVGNGTFVATFIGNFIPNITNLQYKIKNVTDWPSNYPYYFDGSNWYATGNGTLTLTTSASVIAVYFNVLNSSVSVVPVSGANIGYYVEGTFNNWSPSPSYKMSQTSTGLYYLTTTLTSTGEYKVVYVGGQQPVYYGGNGSNNDYGNIPVKAGLVTFYFNPSIASTNSAIGVGDTSKESMRWYFASDINNWNPATMTYIGNGTFAATVTRPSTNDFAGGYGYKILPINTWTPPSTYVQYYFNGSYGAYSAGNGTIIVPQATTVVVYFNVIKSQVSVTAVNLPSTNQVIIAFLDSLNKINATLNATVNTSNLSQFSFSVNGQNVPISSVVDANTGLPGISNYITINLSMPLNPSAVASPMILSINGFAPATVYARYALNDPAFYYSGQLGAIYTPYQTTFRVWSPVSDHVNLLLYSSYNSTTPYATYPMSRNSEGVWSVSVAGNLNGIYYAYRYHRYGQWVTAPDIYSYAANANNTLSEVVDLSQTNPNGWSSDVAPFPANMTDAIIYEVHVQDFTDNPNSGVLPQYQGTYLGFTQRGTTYNGLPTGLDHLAYLGVNYVQLLPIEDYEDPQNPGYNWGYVPYLYMVPEAKYSTTPNNPINTIEEVKQMIMALHSVGIGVVLDISFSHTSYVTTPYTAAVPYYYYNYNEYGQMTNYSGVGNDLKTGNAMVAKLIIDTLKYWMTQYHVSGFRFDQLYLYNPTTIQQIITNLTAINPEVLLYGEPWPAAGAQFVYGDQRGMHMGMFNGYFRDAITGSAPNYSSQGFIDGQPSQNQSEIMEGIVGSITYNNFSNDFASEPDETINYATSHDNYTLWDKITGAQPSWTTAQDIAAQKLGLAIPLLSEGVFFMQGGDEFARTKYGNGNSYNVQFPNEFDWSRLTTFATVDNYVRGLIAIRKAHPAFTIDSAQTIRDNLTFLNTPSGVVGYMINGSAVGDSWPEILVYFNGNTTSQDVTLSGTWNMVVDQFISPGTTISQVSGNFTLSPLSAYVFYK
ncbi:type I pullulanase [Athalassotoga sp.]|uniref:type I pullulanase n=2 Tax=Athalassotoga sp. TaxID=2022597 RepID=UPI003D00B71A